MSKKFKIPWVLSRERIADEDYSTIFRATLKHGKHLRKAQDDLMVAYELARVLKDSLNQGDYDRSVTSAIVTGEIAKHLDKARDRLDTHDTQHRNLFVAYFDLKRQEVRHE